MKYKIIKYLKSFIISTVILTFTTVFISGCDKTSLLETIDDISYLGDRSTEGLIRDSEKEMYKLAKKIVCDNISTPSTAEFPAFDSKFVTSYESTYTVKAYVDAENLMGAMVRSNFTIEIKETDKGYEYKIIKLE